jgi:hypothetical protein
MATIKLTKALIYAAAMDRSRTQQTRAVNLLRGMKKPAMYYMEKDSIGYWRRSVAPMAGWTWCANRGKAVKKKESGLNVGRAQPHEPNAHATGARSRPTRKSRAPMTPVMYCAALEG